MSDSFESWYWGLVLVGNNIDPRDVSSFAAMIAANLTTNMVTKGFLMRRSTLVVDLRILLLLCTVVIIYITTVFDISYVHTIRVDDLDASFIIFVVVDGS